MERILSPASAGFLIFDYQKDTFSFLHPQLPVISPREEMAEKVGISVNGVKKHIVALKKDGVLIREGDNRTGQWEVLG
jgi:predicted HTH transcriptional regulator